QAGLAADAPVAGAGAEDDRVAAGREGADGLLDHALDVVARLDQGHPPAGLRREGEGDLEAQRRLRGRPPEEADVALGGPEDPVQVAGAAGDPEAAADQVVLALEGDPEAAAVLHRLDLEVGPDEERAAVPVDRERGPGHVGRAGGDLEAAADR